MAKIAQQEYDYNSIKNALESVKENVNDNLIALGEINPGFFDSVKNWFSGIGDWVAGIFEGNKDLGILENTNDSLLGENAQIDATDKEAINLPSSEEVEGFFTKIWNWFTGLFNNNDSSNSESNYETEQNLETPIVEDNTNNIDENSQSTEDDNTSSYESNNDNSTENNNSEDHPEDTINTAQ